MQARDLIAIATQLARPFAPSEEVRSGGVGAALVAASGSVYTGVCVDTASSLGFCAEHAAVAEMLKARESEVRMIVAVNCDGNVMAPCGRCRELLWQLAAAHTNTLVVLGATEVVPLDALLPRR